MLMYWHCSSSSVMMSDLLEVEQETAYMHDDPCVCIPGNSTFVKQTVVHAYGRFHAAFSNIAVSALFCLPLWETILQRHHNFR